MRESIIDISRQFFFEVLEPILERHFPEETRRTTFGVFGYGSEVLRLDDEYSADHHWGIRINALMPEELFQQRSAEILLVVEREMPATFRGHNLREGLSGGKGLSLASMEGYLRRTIGLTKVPETNGEWLSVPEEDIMHIINGEIWMDDTGQFTTIRQAFLAYYPEPVRLRRIAHWCRYFSGMGSYALKRAILRYNEWYANITFARALRLGTQLAFLLDKQYCPYDKWTMAFFAKLPRLAYPLTPIINEAVSLATPWARKLELLNQMADVIDQTLVDDGIIRPHPKFTDHPSSGYRLLEHAYAEILRDLPADLRNIVPVWDQVYLEAFHSNYVASLDLATWDSLLNLTPRETSSVFRVPWERSSSRLTHHTSLLTFHALTFHALTPMNSKERVLATLRRQPTDRTPIDCWLYQKQFVEKLEAEWGARAAFLDEFGIDIFVGYVPWPNQTGRLLDVTELANFWPGDPRDPKWLTYTGWTPDFAGSNIVQAVEEHGANRAVIAHLWGIVEGTSRIIGIENCWMQMGKNAALMASWFDRYADWLCGLADSCIEAGVDVITLSDDWGSNQNMLFSPRMWRRLIAPYAGRVVQHIHSRGLPVNLHSDGYIMNIMDDIVAMGYDSMHPVQESAGMDPATIKAQYGDKIVVYGSLDVIDGLFAYDGEALKDYITRCFSIYAPGGGFIFNTGHFVQPDIPPARLLYAYGVVRQLAQKYGNQ